MGVGSALPLLFVWLMLSACSLQRGATPPQWVTVGTTQEVVDSGLSTTLDSAFLAREPGIRIKWLPISTTGTIADPANGYDLLLVNDSPALTEIGGTPAVPIPTLRSDPFAKPPAPTFTPAPFSPDAATPYTTYFGGRRILLYSRLALIGPPSDPQDVRSDASVSKSLKKLGLQNNPILSAGREAGLQQLENALWVLVGTGELKLRGSAYKVVDADAIESLHQAEATGAYSIVPLSTFLKHHTEGRSAILKEDTALILPYEIALPNAAARPNFDPEPARRFATFLFSSVAQDLIAAYRLADRQPYLPATFAGFERPR